MEFIAKAWHGAMGLFFLFSFLIYRSVLSVHLPALFFVLLHAEVDEPDRSALIDTQVTDCGGIIGLFWSGRP